MRTTTLTLPAQDLFARALQIDQWTFAGTKRPAYAPRSAVSSASAGVEPLSWLGRLDAWFTRQEQREREAYLAKSQDIYDLERRIRHLERRGSF